MLVDKGVALNLFLEIVVAPKVKQNQVVLLDIRAVAVGRQHIQSLVRNSDTKRTVIVDARLAFFTPLGLDFNHTGSTTAAILCRFRGILQDGKTLDVGGIYRLEQRQVAHHTVDDNQRVVAACERRGTTKPHCAEGIAAVSLHLQTGHTSTDGIHGVGHLVLVVHLTLVDHPCLGGGQLVEVPDAVHRVRIVLSVAGRLFLGKC